MQKVLLLNVLLLNVISINHIFDNLTITTNVVSQATVDIAQSDTCHKMLVRGQFVHHLSTSNIYKNWVKGSLDVTNAIIDYNSSNTVVNDFDTGSPVGKLIFNTAGLLGTSTNNIYTLSMVGNIISNSSQSLTTTPELVFIDGTDIYYFSGSAIQKSSINSALILGSLSLNKVYEGMAVAPNFYKAMLWDSGGEIAIYNLVNMTQISTFSLEYNTNPGTISISFSQNSLLAVIESDSANPVTIFSLTSLTVIKTIQISDIIVSAFFLDKSSSKLVIFGQNAVVFEDLAEDTTYSIPAIPGTVYGTDHQNNIFVCYNNIISQIEVDFEKIRNTSTANTTNSSSNNSTGQTNGSNTNNTSNNSQNYPTNSTQSAEHSPSPADEPGQANFYKPLSIKILDETVQQIFNSLNSTLSDTTSVANVVTQSLLNSPVTIYFLGFLNFISLSSLYVLLNFQLPEQIYFYLSSVYIQMGKSMLPLIGINPQVSQLSFEKVANERALFFGITSDLLSGNVNDFVMLGINQAILIVVLIAFKLCLSKSNILRLLFNRSFKLMVYGEFISLIQPVTLIWTFLFLGQGAQNIATKANSYAYILLFLFCLFFTIYYLFELINCQKHKVKIEMSKKAKKSRLNQIVNQRLIVIVQNNIHLHEYISKEVLWQWFLCFSNFIFPLLVLLQNPAIFLIVIALYQTFGVYINAKGPERSINQITLSLYPLLFHVCFMIFFWAPWPKVILYTEIVCFAVLIVGLIHNMIVVVVEICHFTYRTLRFNFASNKVSPDVENLVKNEANYLISPVKQSNRNKIRLRLANSVDNQSSITMKRKNHKTSIDKNNPSNLPPNSNTLQLGKTRSRIRQSNELYDQICSVQQKGNKLVVKKAKASQIIDGILFITANKLNKKVVFDADTLQ